MGSIVIASGYFISLAICCLSIFTHPAELRTMYYVCPLTTNEREKLVETLISSEWQYTC